ncbi:hypothetical protein KDD17_08615 [Sulfitobacter albidus]|uniref:Uncharacterized protein n=1 Tax=Sulfitobacter albidus TaxID=2829501 RepID=A0A975JBA9_9RHOB|nr:hypothetical protein [Sulfitobacter albidus]QUJ75100.1 hypothetical protein KDD17_08615 [Sulfitobacter albidus]
MTRSTRLHLAAATALTGLIVSFAMAFMGGPMSRHLPGIGFHLAAIFGAGGVGYVCAGAFGRPRRRGWLMAGFTAVWMTIASAFAGATLLGLTVGTIETGVYGLFAIIDAATSPAAVAVWALCMTGLHLYARDLRHDAAT